MTKEVMLRISGLHAAAGDSGDPDAVEVMSPALFYEKNGKFYILYEEMDDTHTALIKNTLKITPDESLEMIKNGSVTSHMIFEIGHTTNNAYQTPFGDFNLGVTANSMYMHIEEEHITIELNYSLDVNYEHMADCDLSIDIVPRKRETFSLT